MKQVWSVVRLCVLFGPVALSAGPVEDAIVGIMRLSDQPNYTWVTTVSDDARTYDIDGKTARTGYSVVKMPVINSVRRRLGRDVVDTRVDVIFRGNVECVLLVDQRWIRPDELPEPEMISDFDRLGVAAATARPGSIIPAPVGGTVMKGSVIRRPTVTSPPHDEEKRGYSNLQLAICPPHEELGVIVGSHANLKVEGDLVTGTLTDMGAQLLLVRDGQKEISPIRAAGTFKIWLREGMVSRYQLKLEGALSVVSEKMGRVTVLVQQRSTTELRDIGATPVDVPDLARAKLAAR